MKKEDLKGGNAVIFRNGDKGLIVKNWETNGSFTFRIFDINKGFLIAHLGEYDKNLVNEFDHKHDYDIIRVYKDYTFKELLWKEKEKSKLTEDERAILRNLNENYRYIAREKCGVLSLFNTEPYKGSECWLNGFQTCLRPFNHLFKFIKWADEKPYLISDLLEGE